MRHPWPLLALVAAACGPVDDARTRWLQHTLVLDNQAYLERTPGLTGGKFALMSEQPYPFFRGTAAQYARDTMIPGGAGYEATAYMTELTRDVALVGDPHPENLGTYRTGGGEMTLDWNDFDAATYGPYVFDVRRLALGFWLAAPPEVQEAATAAVGRAYAEHIERIAEDRSNGLVVRGDGWGAIVDALIVDALEEGDAADKHGEYVVDGKMFYGDVAPARVREVGEFEQLIIEDSVRPVSKADAAMLPFVVEAYAPEGDLQGLSRRFGSGISSYPQLRWYALLGDDVLIEIKETVDPVILPGLSRLPDPGFATNAERVVYMQRELQGFVDNDPHLGAARLGGQSFRMRERTGYQRGFRVSAFHERLEAGERQPQDLVDFADLAGRLLARAHGWARKQDGTEGARAIAAAIDDDVDGFAAEISAFARSYGPVVDADYVRFVALIEEHGFNLGYVRR